MEVSKGVVYILKIGNFFEHVKKSLKIGSFEHLHACRVYILVCTGISNARVHGTCSSFHDNSQVLINAIQIFHATFNREVSRAFRAIGIAKEKKCKNSALLKWLDSRLVCCLTKKSLQKPVLSLELMGD